MIQRSLRTPMVKFLKEHMEKSGCSFGDKFIRGVHCDKQIAGGYVRGEGIMVCSNHMNIQDEVNQVVIHELIHAYDDCRAANLDWTNCAHHACSEIRAGHLSGDCHYKREFLRGYMKMRGHEQPSWAATTSVTTTGVATDPPVAAAIHGSHQQHWLAATVARLLQLKGCIFFLQEGDAAVHQTAPAAAATHHYHQESLPWLLKVAVWIEQPETVQTATATCCRTCSDQLG